LLPANYFIIYYHKIVSPSLVHFLGVITGFGVNHLHAKLFPMHGTKKLTNNWQMVKSNQNIFFTQYNGYVSSHDYNDYKKQQLIEIYKKLTNEKND